jgi:hypothetical protein
MEARGDIFCGGTAFEVRSTSSRLRTSHINLSCRRDGVARVRWTALTESLRLLVKSQPASETTRTVSTSAAGEPFGTPRVRLVGSKSTQECREQVGPEISAISGTDVDVNKARITSF